MPPSNTLALFETYVSSGLKPIPLRPGTKIPVYKNWNRFWNYTLCQDHLQNNPDCNLGVLLGNVIDVEGDDKQANIKLSKLIGDHPHLSYASPRSIHHLFLNPGNKLKNTKFRGIEFRCKGLQSTIPPSSHPGGTFYKWLTTNNFQLTTMPKPLYDFYLSINSKKKPDKLKFGFRNPWCPVCQLKSPIHEKRYKLEKVAFSELRYHFSWVCNKCRELDIRKLCRKLRKKTTIQA